MLRQVRSRGLNIDAHQRAKLQLWLVHKRFNRAYLCAFVRSRRDWLRTKQYQRVHEFIFINNIIVYCIMCQIHITTITCETGQLPRRRR